MYIVCKVLAKAMEISCSTKAIHLPLKLCSKVEKNGIAQALRGKFGQNTISLQQDEKSAKICS